MSRPDLWFLATRWLVLVFMLLQVVIFIIGVVESPLYVAGHPEKFVLYNWTQQQLDEVWGRIGLSFQWWIEWNLVSSIGFAILVCTVSIFLFIRKGRDWFGLYLAASFFMFGTLAGNTGLVVGAIIPSLGPVLTLLGVLAWMSLILILFIFPNGHFVPGWTRWVGVLIFIGFGVDIIFFHSGTPPPFLLLPLLLMIVIGPASQIYRYRMVSNALERQQTKLVMLAMGIVVINIVIGVIPLFYPEAIDPASPAALPMAVLSSIAPLIMGLIPLSIALAVLRYRLWDIDLVIRRTLAYGAITAILTLIYLGAITVFQQIFTVLTGQISPLAVVLSTLVIVVLFTPLRRRMQAVIDRRFFRQKYNAEQAVATFAAVARNEVELEALHSNLLITIRESLEPESISLWLKK